MKTTLTALFVLYCPFLSFPTASYSQDLITGSTTWGTEISVTPEGEVTIGDLIGSRKIEFGPIVLNGKKNRVELDLPAISTAIDANTGGGSIEADLKVFRLHVASEGQNRRHWVGVSGRLGSTSVRIELDFSPGMAAITGSAARSVGDTPFRIVVTDESTGAEKVITGNSKELKWWQ